MMRMKIPSSSVGGKITSDRNANVSDLTGILYQAH